MAQSERQREERAAQGKKQATKRGASRRQRGSTQEGWQLSFEHWTWLNVLMEAMASCGGAVRYGFTRDGGALALGMYMGDDYGTEYVTPNEDFVQAIQDIAAAWLPDDGKALTLAQKRLELAFQDFQVNGRARR